MQLEIERQALQREEDARLKNRLKEIEQRIADLKEKSSGMKAKWQSEKAIIEHIRAAKAEMEQLKLQLNQARNAGDLGRASGNSIRNDPSLNRNFNWNRKTRETSTGRRHASRKKWTRKTLPRSSLNGRAYLSRKCSKARCISS
jgi:hypothetical protein